MDSETLIRVAQQKGLRLDVVDGVLKVRGPKKASALVEQLFANKTEVLTILRDLRATAPHIGIPTTGDGDKTTETPAIAGVSSPAMSTICVDCGALHVQPGRWEHRDGRATCPNCGKFMGYLGPNGGQDGIEA